MAETGLDTAIKIEIAALSAFDELLVMA